MKPLWKTLAFLSGAVGAGVLVYGALVESHQLVVEEIDLELPDWPESLDGYKIALLADMHLRDKYTVALAKKAVAAALEHEPDAFVIPGDIVAYWKPETLDMSLEVLEPLKGQKIIVTTGNHEFWGSDPGPLFELCEMLGFIGLRNESHFDGQITWIGIESAKSGKANPRQALANTKSPRIVVWHEPDAVDQLAGSASLMLSGHSHGGQFRFPGGFTPMYTKMGRNYPRGFYPLEPTPLYVSRGLGTTGPPSRFNCPPELTILRLQPRR